MQNAFITWCFVLFLVKISKKNKETFLDKWWYNVNLVLKQDNILIYILSRNWFLI